MIQPKLVRIYMPTYLKRFYHKNPNIADEVYAIIRLMFEMKIHSRVETNLFDLKPRSHSSYIELKYPETTYRNANIEVFVVNNRYGRLIVKILRQHFRACVYNFIHTWSETRNVKYCVEAFLLKYGIDGYISDDGIRKVYYKEMDRLRSFERYRLAKPVEN